MGRQTDREDSSFYAKKNAQELEEQLPQEM
jgi:hypothetical protein